MTLPVLSTHVFFLLQVEGMKTRFILVTNLPLKLYPPMPHKCAPDAHSTYGKLLSNIKVTLPSLSDYCWHVLKQGTYSQFVILQQLND